MITIASVALLLSLSLPYLLVNNLYPC